MEIKADEGEMLPGFRCDSSFLKKYVLASCHLVGGTGRSSKTAWLPNPPGSVYVLLPGA